MNQPDHFTAPYDSGPRKSTLKRRLLGAARWTLAGHFIAQALRLCSNLILTRMLAPDLFGVMSVGYMVFTGLGMLSDLGLFAVVARSHRGDEPKFLNVVWITQMMRGALITLGALTLSGAAAYVAKTTPFLAHSVYADARIPGVIAVLSLYGILSAFESTKTLWARRNLLFAALTKVELASQIGTTTIILGWAVIDPSIWALVGGFLLGTALRTVLSHLALPGPTNRLEWDASAFREIIDFGKWALVSSPISFLLTSGDRLSLGVFLDATTMGFYSVATLLIAALQTVVGKIVGEAVLPALGEVIRSRPGELKATAYRIRRPLDIACIIPAGALFMLGDLIVRILYDSRYEPAGWMLSVLALTLATTQFAVFDQCLIALGKMRLLSALNLVRLIALYSLIPLFYWIWGVRGAIIAVPASALVNTGILLCIQAKLKLLDFKRELFALPLLASGLLAGWLLDLLLRQVLPLAR